MEEFRDYPVLADGKETEGNWEGSVSEGTVSLLLYVLETPVVLVL